MVLLVHETLKESRVRLKNNASHVFCDVDLKRLRNVLFRVLYHSQTLNMRTRKPRAFRRRAHEEKSRKILTRALLQKEKIRDERERQRDREE